MFKISQLIINHSTEAIGLDEAPQFSWKIESDERGTLQTAYRLQICTLSDFQNPCFDSEWTMSGNSQNVAIDDFNPARAEEYFARASIKNQNNEASEWSDAARFVTGLAGDWQASYITAENPPCPENSKGTYVRGEFEVDGKIRSALLFTSGLGIYVPYLNGQRAGEDLLAPGWTSYHKHALYQTNDVTDLIQPGKNAVGAMLGAGWYKGLMGFLNERNNYGTQTAFLCQLIIRYADGREQIVTSDASWQGCDSPVIFAEIYDGEIYDARMAQDGWCLPDADNTGWSAVSVVKGNFDVLNAQPGCRIRKERILPAIKLLVTPEGDRVVDFGQNLTGWPEFTLRGKAEHEYVLQCFEVLDANGNVYTANLRSAKEELRYICRDDAAVTYHPDFTFYGFRYMHLVDWPKDATAEDFCAWVIHSDMQPAGEFECSEPLVNQLHHNILWGLKGNFLDVPTDCPQRNERMGWTGDAQIFCYTATCLMDVHNFYRKWLKDVQADQTPEGGIAHVVPDIVTGRDGAKNDWLLSQGTHSAAGWADAIVICPWTLYLAYGDKQVLLEQYDSMKAWIEFMRTHAVDNIWNYQLQFGDWVALDAEEGSYFGATPNDLTCTAYYAYSTELFAKIARILGRTSDAETYENLYGEIVKKFQQTFFAADGEMTAQTQTAHILALHFNLVPEIWRDKTANVLLKLLEKEDNHMVTGFMGTTFFTHALSNHGHLEAAYDLLLKEDFPSWLYQVKMGATTIWEHWDGMRPDGTMWSPDMNSFNHYAYGAIGEWLYRGIAGLNVDEADPAYHHALLRPQISRRMQYAGASIETNYGKLALKWTWEGDQVRVEVEIPANTSASLCLDQATEMIDSNGADFAKIDSGLCAELFAGKYTFVYKSNN